ADHERRTVFFDQPSSLVEHLGVAVDASGQQLDRAAGHARALYAVGRRLATEAAAALEQGQLRRGEHAVVQVAQKSRGGGEDGDPVRRLPTSATRGQAEDDRSRDAEDGATAHRPPSTL